MEGRNETHNQWLMRKLAKAEMETKLDTSDRCYQCEINAYILVKFPKRRRKQAKIPFMEQIPKGFHTCNPLNSLYRKLFNVAIDDYPKHKVDLNELKCSLKSELIDSRLKNGFCKTKILGNVQTKSEDEKTNTVLTKSMNLLNNCSNKTTYLSPKFCHDSTSDDTQFKNPSLIPDIKLRRSQRVKLISSKFGKRNVNKKTKLRSVLPKIKIGSKFTEKEILSSGAATSSYVLNNRLSNQKPEIESVHGSLTKEENLTNGHLKTDCEVKTVRLGSTFTDDTEMCPLTRSVFDMLSSTNPPMPMTERMSKSIPISDNVQETESTDFKLSELIQGIYLSFHATTPSYPY